MIDEPLVRLAKPAQRVGHRRCSLGPRLDVARSPLQRAASERVVVVHDFAGTDVHDDRLDAPRGARGERAPLTLADGSEIRHERLALVRLLDASSVERLVEEIESLSHRGPGHRAA